MVAYHVREPTQRRPADHIAMQLGLLMFMVEGNQRTKAHYSEEVQLTEIKDQRSLQL